MCCVGKCNCAFEQGLRCTELVVIGRVNLAEGKAVGMLFGVERGRPGVVAAARKEPSK